MSRLLSWSTTVLISCLFLFPFGVLAQERGGISGTVSDEHGAKIRDAIVYLRSRAGLELISTTDGSGTFVFGNIRAGEYLLEVKATGFSSVTSELSVEQADRDLRTDLVLPVARIDAGVVVSATGTPQQSEEVAKVISVFDAQRLELRHTLSLPEALRSTPGLRVQQQGSPGSLTTIRLRGQRTFDTALLLDGLRVRDASDINGSAVSLLADLIPAGWDRVEVLRGSGSSIFGTNAVGGVVNLVPLSGAGRLKIETDFEGGSLSSFRERMRVSGSQNFFSYNLGVERTDVRRGIDGNDEYGNSAGGGRFQFHFNNTVSVTANLYGNIANARLNDSPFALPGAFDNDVQYPSAVPGFNFQSDFNNPDQGRRNRTLVGAVRLAHDVGPWLSYTLSYQRVSSNRRNYNGPAIDPEFQSFYPFGDFEFLNLNRGKTDTFDARVHGRLRANLFTLGFEFERESLFQQAIPSFSVFNNTTDRQKTFAVFGQDQLSLLDDRLQVSLGLRAQSFSLNTADRPGFLSAIDTEKSLTGDGAVSYFIESTKTKLRAHAGNGFRAPALFERFGVGTFAGVGFARFGDPTIRAEQSISVDGGVDQRLAGDRLLFNLTYFYTRLQRVIAFRSFSVDPLGLGRFSGYVNEPGGIARGLETSLQIKPMRNTDLNMSYTYTNSDRATSGGGLVREYVIPDHALAVSATHRFRSVVVNLDVNHTGSYISPVFENNFPFRMAELRFPGFTKVDVFARHERGFGDAVKGAFFLGAENLLDQEYFENGFRAPGLLVRGGFGLRF